MSEYQRNIVYLSEAQKNTLFATGSITVDGKTITYSDSDIYVTPQEIHMSIGTVTEGQVANASITGTAENPVLNLVLPTADTSNKADKANTILDTTLSHGRKANTTVGDDSIAYGNIVEASGLSSQAFGSGTKATAGTAHAEGSSSTASGQASHVEGAGNTASGQGSHAEGISTEATSYAAHAEGSSTHALGSSSHAEGSYSQAENTASHAEGYGTISNASGAHTEGRYNVPDSYDSWPEWVANTTYAVNDKVKVTTGDTVKGYSCYVANSDSTFTSSHWLPDANKNFVHIVGNGKGSSSRSNAYALEWNGTGRYAGDVYVHANNDSTGGTKLASIDDVPNYSTIREIISGTTVTINGEDHHQYICGEVTSISITTPAEGIIDVVFISGSTPALLTIAPPNSQTMKWSNDFDTSSLEANTRYELNISDGIWGVATQWT